MHQIEPFYNWRHYYVASEDEHSPFFGREYSEIYFSNTVYNYYIHPQWDAFGSPTLYLKVLMCDSEKQYAIIELFGEWNDLIDNDIMLIYRNVIEAMIDEGIKYFILLGENILNFHAESNDYYEEWFDNIDDGWIVCINFRKHVIDEFTRFHLDHYLAFGGQFDSLHWRKYTPHELFANINALITKRLNP